MPTSELTEWIKWFLIIIVSIIMAWEKAKRWYFKRNNKDRRRAGDNPHAVPGRADACIKISNRVGKIDTEIEFLRETLKEFKLDTEKNLDIIYAELRKRE